MPRQIIDTESSRPAYIRRNATIVVFVILIVALAVYLFVMHNRQSWMNGNPYGTVSPKSVQPPSQPAHSPGK